MSRKELSRPALERLAWRHTHRDYKGTSADGTKTVLGHDRKTGGTVLVTLASLTDVELFDKIPRKFQPELSEEECVALGRCAWETEFGSPWLKRCQKQRQPGRIYCAEHVRDARDNYPQSDTRS